MDTKPGAAYFGRWLELTMANRELKQRGIAKALHVHDSAVSRWKSGQGAPALDTAMRLAKLLDVDPIRMAVTAGLMDPALAGAEPLPLPEPTAQRVAVKAQLMKVRGLSPRERQRLIDLYDQMGAVA